jgi:MoaD family protein
MKMSKVKVKFYGALARTTGDKEVEVESSTLGQMLNQLAVKYGESFKEKIYDKKGNPKRFVNIYVNGKDIRFLNRLDTTIKQGDTVSIMPAVTGG